MKLALDPATGLLPIGEHELDWSTVCNLFGTTAHRIYLLECLHTACSVLKRAGVSSVWLDGSFVTSNHRPGDYDLSYTLTQEIFDALPDNPFKLKDADRKIRAQFAGDIKAEPMPDGAIYHRDLFPNVVSHTHKGKTITGVKKGIVVLDPSTLPNTFNDEELP